MKMSDFVLFHTHLNINRPPVTCLSRKANAKIYTIIVNVFVYITIITRISVFSRLFNQLIVFEFLPWISIGHGIEIKIQYWLEFYYFFHAKLALVQILLDSNPLKYKSLKLLTFSGQLNFGRYSIKIFEMKLLAILFAVLVAFSAASLAKSTVDPCCTDPPKAQCLVACNFTRPTTTPEPDTC